MKKILLSSITAILLVLTVGCSSNSESSSATSEEGGEKNGLISFGVPSWTSTVPPTMVASLIIQEMGYEVEEVDADAGAVYTGLSRGDIDVFMDSWFPAQKHYIEKYSDTIEDIAVSYDEADSGPVVPEYMEDINDVGDLRGKEDMFDNKLLSIGKGDPATKNLENVLKGYDLDITQVNSSEGAMMAEAIRKMEKEEPVLLYGWRPHTMFNKYDLKILTNKETPEWFNDSSVNVVVNKDLKETAPDVYEFLTNWSIPLEDVEEMIRKIDEKESPEELAREWIDNNQDKVKEMTGK